MTEKVRRAGHAAGGLARHLQGRARGGPAHAKEAAIEKVFRGVTTTTEMVRVTGK